MIISASRRTDIPALYAPWFRNRLEAGWCALPNPMNAHQVARVSLRPYDVAAIVFWTRHARPLFETLPVLDARGYRYYFQYTITGYGGPVEARNPPIDVAIHTFRDLAQRVRPGAVVWRYDPILVGAAYPAAGHLERFSSIASRLEGSTRRVVVSIVDLYRRTERRLGAIRRMGDELSVKPDEDPSVPEILDGIVAIASRHGMTVEACAEERDFSGSGIERTKCVDDRLLAELFGDVWSSRKDPGQRPACGCIPSKDIGMPDSCTLGCSYCYATRSDAFAHDRKRQHDSRSPSLVGWHEPTTAPSPAQGNLPFA